MDRFITAIAATVGIPLVVLVYIRVGDALLDRLPERLHRWLRPYFWALPALAFAFVFMVYPTIRTVVLSFYNADSTRFIGFRNYVYFFTFPDTLISLRNTIFWLIFYTLGSVVLGLVIAILLDRVKYESIAKIAIFLPMPMSAVAASVIWKFMFDYRPPGTTQTGTLNAALGTFGAQPVAWLVNSTTNNPALIFIGVWMITGFCMVILSASLKSISPELLEAARIDGASEFRVVRLIVAPLLWPTITVVGTTMVIQALKQFDVVYVLTNGAYDTDVIATQMFRQLTSGDNFGRAAAVGVVLFISIIPLLVINIRRFQQQEEMR